MTHVDVIVVGGGIVGLSTALNLSQQGIKTALLDKRPLATAYETGNTLTDYDTRVSALTRRSQMYLQQLGVWSAVHAERCTPYHNMCVWDGEGTARIEFNADSIGAEDIGHIVENRIVAKVLFEALLDSDVIQYAPTNIIDIENQGDSICIQLDNDSLSAEVLIAADGAMSTIREQQGYFTRELDYGHSAIVATIQVEHPHQYTCWQRFMHSGPLALLPLDDPHKVSIVWSCDHIKAQQLMALDDHEFCSALSRASEQVLGDALAVGPRQCFPLRQRHTTDYVKNRCVLIGDAAHTIHPLAGQGMNIGIGDSIALVEELLRSKRRGLELAHPQGLKRFQRRRKTENTQMIMAMQGFKRLFAARDLHVLLARNEGMRQLNNIESIKKLIVAQALG